MHQVVVNKPNKKYLVYFVIRDCYPNENKLETSNLSKALIRHGTLFTVCVLKILITTQINATHINNLVVSHIKL